MPDDHPQEFVAIDVSAPYDVAKAYLERRWTRAGLLTLWHQADTFFRWTGTHYEETPLAEIRGELYEFFDRECVDPKNHPIKPKRALVDNTLDALKAAAILQSRFAAPCWLTDDPRVRAIPAAALLPVANGLLNVQTRDMYPPDPALFARFGLPFAFDPQAPTCPPQWCAFLQSIWPDDPDSIRCLRQMFGYFLTPDHSHQKMFLLVGPKRSGKGTIAAMLKALIGERNFVSPTLAAFGNHFGLEPLTGATVACVSDARLSNRSDLGQIAENLLKISAGDHSTIPRKFRQDWNGVIPARIVMLTNELPRIADPSGAVASRFIVLRMTQSFFGREDKGLAARLRPELPAILNWALVGLDDLRDEGWFTEPASSRKIVQELHDLAAPIGAFVREECVVEVGSMVEKDLLFSRWRQWCTDNHRDERLAGDTRGFGAKLMAAAPGVESKRLRLPGGERSWFYVGIRRRQRHETDTEDALAA